MAGRSEEEHPIERTTVEARQGDRSKVNLRVLILSLTGIIIVFSIVYFVFYGSSP